MLDLLQTLRTVSPTSLKVTKHLLDLGANFTLGECLQMEYRLAVHFVEDSDFKEGTIGSHFHLVLLLLINNNIIYRC